MTVKFAIKLILAAAAAMSFSSATSAYARDVVTPAAGLPAGAGGQLFPGDAYVSPDGRFRLAFQTDGNFVLYQGTTALWASNTVIGIPTNGNTPFYVQFQGDGNLVLYDLRAGVTFSPWDSRTQGHPDAILNVQNDGNVVIYDGSHRKIWATNTCCH